MLFPLLSGPFVEALGWTVLHSLWQGTMLALGLAFVLAFFPRKSALWRYRLTLYSLFGLMAITVMNFYRLYLMILDGVGDAPLGGQVTAPIQWTFWQEQLLYFETHLPMIVAGWLLGFAVFSLRLLGGLVYLRRLRYRGISELETAWEKRLSQLSKRMKISRRVQLKQSSLVQVPVVIGFFKPLILLPFGTINQLTVAEVEAVLLHELGHILRQDFLLNMIQSIIEVLFYFNPGVWWISAMIRVERENCCDDLAVALSGNALLYAKSLLKLQQNDLVRHGLAMTLFSQRNSLLRRIQRILHPSLKHSSAMEKLMITMLLLIALCCMSLSKESFRPSLEDPVVTSLPPGGSPIEIASAKESSLDTLPKGRIHFSINKKGEKKVDAEVADREIKALTIDGEKIEATDFGLYEELVEQLLADMPPPPSPPPLPAVPAPMPLSEFAPAPPPPPAPPPAPVAPAPAAQSWPSPPNLAMVPPSPPVPSVPPVPSIYKEKEKLKLKEKEKLKSKEEQKAGKKSM